MEFSADLGLRSFLCIVNARRSNILPPLNKNDEIIQNMSQPAAVRDESYVLTLEEIGNLAAEGGKSAETLMNVVALIGKRFKTEVCSAYLLEPDRTNLIL